jgi:hypothetical protein
MDWLTAAESQLLDEAQAVVARLRDLARCREQHAWGFDPNPKPEPREWRHVSDELDDEFQLPTDPKFVKQFSRGHHSFE